jgi:hypothetical protein
MAKSNTTSCLWRNLAIGNWIGPCDYSTTLSANILEVGALIEGFRRSLVDWCGRLASLDIMFSGEDPPCIYTPEIPILTPGSDCPTGKEQFATQTAARERRNALRASGRAEPSLRTYRCPDCGCLHVGHRGRHKEVLRRRQVKRGRERVRRGK